MREMCVPCAREGGWARKVGCTRAHAQRPRPQATAAYRFLGTVPTGSPSIAVEAWEAVTLGCRSTSEASACRGLDSGGAALSAPLVHTLRWPDGPPQVI